MQNLEYLLSRKHINKIAIPSIFAGIAEPFLSLTDLAIIGQVKLNSVEVLAAIGVVGSFISAIIWILAQAKTAISTTVGQYSEPDKIKDAKLIFPQLLFVNLIVCLFILAISLPLARSLFEVYSIDGLTLDFAVDYYKIRAYGIPITLLTFSIFGVYRGLQNTIWAMYISIGGGLLNVVLDYGLIHGINGLIPPMHIQGAAYASIISQIFMLFAAIWILYKKTDFRIKVQFPFHPKIKALLLFSVNLFIRTLTLNIVIYLTNKYAAQEGDIALATHTILINIWLFTCFFIDGYSNAANAISGKLIALKAYDKIAVFWRKILKYSMLLSCITALSIFILNKEIAMLFTKDKDVISTFQQMSLFLVLLQFLNGFTFSLDGLGKGLGMGKQLRNSLLIATFFGFLPILFVLQHLEYSLSSIWIPFLVWMLLRGLILYRSLIYRQSLIK